MLCFVGNLIHHNRADPKLAQILMSVYTLKEVPCLERLLELKLTPGLKYNAYILAIARDAGRTFGSKKLLVPNAYWS